MGTLGASLANDYRVFDDTISGSFISKAAAGNTTISLTNVDGAMLSVRELGGLFQLGDKRWSLPANQISAGHEPKPGDSFTDDASVVWELLDAKLDDFGISWDCTGRRAR